MTSMSDMPEKIGPYEINREIGRGGMGRAIKLINLRFKPAGGVF